MTSAQNIRNYLNSYIPDQSELSLGLIEWRISPTTSSCIIEAIEYIDDSLLVEIVSHLNDDCDEPDLTGIQLYVDRGCGHYIETWIKGNKYVIREDDDNMYLHDLWFKIIDDNVIFHRKKGPAISIQKCFEHYRYDCVDGKGEIPELLPLVLKKVIMVTNDTCNLSAMYDDGDVNEDIVDYDGMTTGQRD